MNLRFLLLLALLIPMVSCSDDDDPSGGDGGGDGGSESFFEVTIDGETFRAEGSLAFGENATGGTGNKWAAYGTDDPLSDNPKRVFVVLPELDGVGTYDLSPGSDGIGNFIQGDQLFITSFGAGEGTLEITEQTDERTTGTFSYTAFNADGSLSKTFSDGSFDVAFN